MNTWKGHTHVVHAAAFLPTHSDRLVTASSDHSVKLWNLTNAATHQSSLNTNAGFTSLGFVGGGTVLVAGQANGAIRLYKLKTMSLLRTLRPKEVSVYVGQTSRIVFFFLRVYIQARSKYELVVH